jgi:hypothetical protein
MRQPVTWGKRQVEATQQVRRGSAGQVIVLFALGILFLVAWFLLTTVAAHAAETGSGPAGRVPAELSGLSRPAPAQAAPETPAAQLPSPAPTAKSVLETTGASVERVDREHTASQLRRTARAVEDTVETVFTHAVDEARRTTRTLEALREPADPVQDAVDRVERPVRDITDARPLPSPVALTGPATSSVTAAPDSSTPQRRSPAVGGDAAAPAVPASSGQERASDAGPTDLPPPPTVRTSTSSVDADDGAGEPGSPLLPCTGAVEMPLRGASSAGAADACLTERRPADRHLIGRVPAGSWWSLAAPAGQPDISPD